MAVESGETSSKPRGRPRSQDCHHAVLAAAVFLLENERYADVTMEGIAAHAQVAKQTLYKWWPSKARLVMEACAAGMFGTLPVPDTGNVEEDLRQFLVEGFRVLTRGNVGPTFAGLIADAQSDDELRLEFRETFIASRRKVAASLVERGIARGQLREDIDVPLVLDLLYGPVWYRLLLRNAPLNRAFAAAIVDHVLPALRPGSASAAAPSATLDKSIVAAKKPARRSSTVRRAVRRGDP